ncbi:putative UDP-N-acetylmuramoyl-tripeptide--D-alanyl-D-alanine ligase [Holospora obtusa F1]|uniref:UDP-N-acetylmuramoyl-tripeptide--D-alanyl-D-alanine ligase n=1 Tax=Holospora obtusa F1 TaxID=1399147 RepID=W6TTF0_HOLOB|nr:UDP-N-acetylmuramoyl-tripeptide--D-alanyl-D-alanine ligase [Holospora obtusa]ETZ07067.1 putative UDP-N-acetylmuramoyl-tripeptide--D-alanyl-D-alanine ligase [Holospora obtusa F1]
MNALDVNCEKSFSHIVSKLPSYAKISIDTRTLSSGDVFVALDGKNFKGHKFAQEALYKGACAVVQSFESTFTNALAFCVQDPLAFLHYIARHRRYSIKGLCYAVTGSVGKTTTKEGIAHVLKHFGQTYFSASSYNNHIGVPLSIANCPPGARYTVFEVGTNHPGEIASLVALVKPDVSVLTPISEAHIGNFHDISSIVLEKFEIFTGQIGVLPYEYSFDAALKNKISWLTYGLKKGDVHIINISDHGEVQVRTPQGKVTYRPSSLASHWIEGNLGILAALIPENIDLQQGAEHLSSFVPLRGRGAVICYDLLKIRCIDESYNAAPLAMRACILDFAIRKVPGRKILCLGEMGELGVHGPRLHQELIAYIEQVKGAHIFLVGELFQKTFEILSKMGYSVYWATEVFALLDTVKSVLLPLDTLLVKGSNATRMYQICSFLEKWNISLIV